MFPKGFTPITPRSATSALLMNHTWEREEDFCYMFGRLLGTVELSERKLAEIKVAVKAKRDDLIMMDNLIKLKEREVEDLQTEVNSARSGKGKQSPASVTKINSPCKPTSFSQTASQPEMASAQGAPRTLDECSTLSAITSAEIKVNNASEKLFPPASKKDEEELKTLRRKLDEVKKAKEEMEAELSNTQIELLKIDTTRQKLEIQVEDIKGKLAHQEEVKGQREDLERRTNELMVTSNRLEGLEQELEANKDALKKLEEQLAGENEKTKSVEEKLAAEVSKNSKLKSQLMDAKDEVKMNKVATKKNAKDALEVETLKEKAVELEKEVVRLKSLAEAHERDAAALEVLRTELKSKTAEMSALMKRNELLAREASANSYELEKTKQERSSLMAHYENKFKGLQNDLDEERSRKSEVK